MVTYLFPIRYREFILFPLRTMSFFEQILADTKVETEAHRRKTSLKNLKRKARDCPPPLSFYDAIAEPYCGLIAEIKLKSPSMGNMVPFDRERIEKCPLIYDRHPIVKAVSVLTNETHFGGSPKMFRYVRNRVRKPIIRKDFITQEYEIWHARVMGADAILLMACAIKDASLFQDLHQLADDLGMAVLCEVHTEEELKLLPKTAKICGVNCRNFESNSGFRWSKLARLVSKDATTKLSRFDLLKDLPDTVLRVAESGISPSNLGDVIANFPFNAALVGTSILKSVRGISAELNEFTKAFAHAKASDQLAKPEKNFAKAAVL